MKVTADAEQAKSTGGMLALIPSQEDAERLAVPGGEPVEDLHLTIIYFGEDVTSIDPGEIVRALDDAISGYPVFEARAFGLALFNPVDNPCSVYLIGDNDDITPFRQDALNAVEHLLELHPQHEPFHAHITGHYGAGFGHMIDQIGDLVFDRAELHWAGQTYSWNLR